MIKRLCLSLLLAVLLAAPLWAANDDAYISLFDGTSEAQDTSKSKKVSDEDDGSIFSFLNFKPKKKEETKLNVADEKRMSPLEQMTKLADGGDVNAQLMLGYSYLYGDNGATIDYDKAFSYYGKAATQNDNVGLNNLGSLYYSGIGIERNTAKAAILFEKAAKLGNAEAAVNLAFILISGNGVQKNIPEAVDLFEKAAGLNNPTAKFMYGYILYEGKLRSKDYKKAAVLMKDAAGAQFDEAQFVLSQMYINGQGFPQNYGNAVKYLKMAVSQGNVQAMMTLGDILARGEKYNKDWYTSHVMFNLAAVRGAKGATEKRDALETKLKIDEVLQAQAEAERFREKPSELTAYIHQTFGNDIKTYVDSAK